MPCPMIGYLYGRCCGAYFVLANWRPSPPWEDTKAGVSFVTEDPRLVKTKANPTTAYCRGARAK